MTPEEALLLVAAALAAGALNAVAGGGTFLTFPALLLAGVPPIQANATSTVALWPGSIAGAWGFRHDMPRDRAVNRILGAASLAGGLAGALLLLVTPQPVFRGLVPWLLLAATVIFAFGGKTLAWLGAHPPPGQAPTRQRLAALGALQLLIAIYGGYFGAGIGILMLAGLAAMGLTNIHAMNGLKGVLAALINGVAVVTFVVAGIVVWWAALLMVVGAVAGGYGGARLSRRVEPRTVRAFVLAYAVALTAYFFLLA